MPWQEIHIRTTAELAPELSNTLTLLGAEAITFHDAGDDPIFEPDRTATPLWNETIVVALFDHQQDLKGILDYLSDYETKVIQIADEDWERRCLDSFQPIQFTPRLWVCPSWHTPPDANALNIILDPGLAFGTGTHATTSLCLEWLDAHVKAGQDIIDYGCGSGILAIAALMLGAQRAIGIDNDPLAIEATLSNGERNQFAAPILEAHNIDYPIPFLADILVANILAQPLIELAPKFAKLVKTGGQICLSGILTDQSEQVSQAYAPWFSMQPIDYKENWVRLTGTRK